MSASTMRRLLVASLLLAAASVILHPARTLGEDMEITRKVKSKVAPTYPEIARRMNITGTVRLAVVVAPNGTVKSTKAIGGHPLLVSAAEDALKRWKFETAPNEDSGIVEFKFKPDN
ncbi:MAG: energy transducer TonB [Acidobacteria bacterium]|nr:energy transducer TonB [Acidobacteriota bacterium]